MAAFDTIYLLMPVIGAALFCLYVFDRDFVDYEDSKITNIFKTTISSFLSIVFSCLPLLKTVRHIKSPILMTMDRNQRSAGTKNTYLSVFRLREKCKPKKSAVFCYYKESLVPEILQCKIRRLVGLEVLAAIGYYRCKDEITSNALRGLRFCR